MRLFYHHEIAEPEKFVEWTNKTFDDLGKIVLYKNKLYEWTMYDGSSGSYDYTLYYTKISEGKAYLYKPEEVIGDELICECGKDKHGFTTHAYWCKKYGY